MDAPRERVFRAFSDPALLARWWGPQGFTSTFPAFDLRPGGAWRFVMQGRRQALPERERVVEVVTPERSVFRHPRPGHRFLMTMTFAEEAGRTRLTWRMRFDSREEAEQVVPGANEQNFESSPVGVDGRAGLMSRPALDPVDPGPPPTTS